MNLIAKKIRWMVLLTVALCSSLANAQTVFFDDFDGSALAPHWFQPPANWWDYNVSNSMLNVTALNHPSSQHSPGGNYATMTALFAAQSDFHADIWMGWNLGEAPHKLAFHIMGIGGNPGVASIGYRHETPGNPVIFAQSADAPPVVLGAPLAGVHHFAIRRSAGQFTFYFNANLVGSFQDNWSTPAGAIMMEFWGPYPGTFTGFTIDRIQVIPSPNVLCLIVALVFGRTRRSR